MPKTEPWGISIENATRSKVLDCIFQNSRALLREGEIKKRRRGFRNDFSQTTEIPAGKTLSVWLYREDDMRRNVTTVTAHVLPIEIFGCDESFAAKSLVTAVFTVQ